MRLPIPSINVLVTSIFIATLGSFAPVFAASDGMSGVTSESDTETSAMGGMDAGMDAGMSADMSKEAPTVPPVQGFINGEQMLFIHTEISDAGVGKILTDMMGGSPVPVVPSLAKAPAEMLAPVYVFANGYAGTGPMGPLGGQPDIFDAAPGDPGYSPLRNIIVVTWGEGANIRDLTSMAELQFALDNGEVTTSEPGVVVNMPFLKWPGGSR